jgi:hypothetical protein
MSHSDSKIQLNIIERIHLLMMRQKGRNIRTHIAQLVPTAEEMNSTSQQCILSELIIQLGRKSRPDNYTKSRQKLETEMPDNRSQLDKQAWMKTPKGNRIQAHIYHLV